MAGPAPIKPSLQARALRWLSTREHSRHELRAKLLRIAEGDEASAEVEALLDRLTAGGYLSEARFVESRIHAREARFGNRRIEAELRRHGVAPDASMLDRLRRDELERARQVWMRKFGARVAVTPAERARQMRFLAARGFSADVVRRVVRGVDDDPTGDAPDPD